MLVFDDGAAAFSGQRRLEPGDFCDDASYRDNMLIIAQIAFGPCLVGIVLHDSKRRSATWPIPASTGREFARTMRWSGSCARFADEPAWSRISRWSQRPDARGGLAAARSGNALGHAQVPPHGAAGPRSGRLKSKPSSAYRFVPR